MPQQLNGILSDCFGDSRWGEHRPTGIAKLTGVRVLHRATTQPVRSRDSTTSINHHMTVGRWIRAQALPSAVPRPEMRIETTPRAHPDWGPSATRPTDKPPPGARGRGLWRLPVLQVLHRNRPPDLGPCCRGSSPTTPPPISGSW